MAPPERKVGKVLLKLLFVVIGLTVEVLIIILFLAFLGNEAFKWAFG